MSSLTKYINSRKRKFSMNTKEIIKTNDNILTIDAKEAGNAVDYSIYGNIPKSRNLVPYPYSIFVNSTVYTKNGITLQDLGDGSIMANGTATERTIFSIIPAFSGYRLPYADYFCLSGCPYSKGDILLRAKINKYSTTNEAVVESEALDYGTTALLNAKKLTNPSIYGYLDERDKIYNNYVLTLDLIIAKDAVIDYQIIKPQINMGNEPLEYERGYFSDRRIDFLDTDGYDNNILKINKDYYRIKYDNKEYLNYDQNINKTSNGVTLTSYTDKILNLNGTATADTTFLLKTGDNTLFSKYNQYKIYGANNAVKIGVVFYDATDAVVKESIAPTTYSEYFKSDINLNDITEEYTTIRIFLSINNGTVLNNVKIVPSIKAVDNKYNLITDQNNIEIDPYKTYMLSGARDRANFTLTYYKNNEVVNTQTNTPRNLIHLPYNDYNFPNDDSTYKYYQNGKVIFIGKPSIEEYVINNSITVNPDTQYTFFPNTVYMQDIKFVITEYNNNNELIYTNTYNGYANDNKTVGYLISNHYPMNYTDDMSVNNICFRTQSSTSYIKIAITFGDYPLYNGIPKLIEHNDTLYNNIIQYPYAISTVTRDGLTVTSNSANKLILNGTPTANIGITIYTDLVLDKHKKYILIGGTTAAYLRLIFYKGNKQVNEITNSEWKNSTIIDMESIDYEYDKISVAIFVKQNYVFGNMPIYPRLEEYDDNDDIILIEPKDYVEHDTCKLTYTVPNSINNSMIKPKLRECEIVGVGDKTINILPYPYTKQFTTTYNQDGITAQVKADGSIILNGTCTNASGKTYIQIASIKNVPAGTYTLSGYPSNGLAANCGITAEAWSSDTVKTTVYWENQNTPSEKRTNTTSDTSIIKVFIFVNVGFSCDGIVIKPQFELNSVATKYEKYDSSKDTIKNRIPYPYHDTTKTEHGITFTDNGDGSITVNGTATSNATYFIKFRNIFTVEKGIYTLSGCPTGGNKSSYFLGIDVYNDETWLKNFSDNGEGVLADLTSSVFTGLSVYIRVTTGTTVNNIVFKPTLELGIKMKNLIPYPYYQTSKTTNGITFTDNGDGSITVNGTATNTIWYHLAPTDGNNTLKLPAAKYYFSDNCDSTSSPRRFSIQAKKRVDNGWTNLLSMGSGNGVFDITKLQSDCVWVVITIFAGDTFDNVTFKPQLIALSNVESNKNLIPFPYLNIVNTKTVSGITFTDNFDGTITANGTSTADIKLILMERYKSSICLQPNKKYIISGLSSDYNGSTSLNYGVSYIRLNDANTELGGGGSVNGNEKYILTIPNDNWNDFNKEQLYIYVNNNTTIDNLTFKPMIIDIDELPNERKRWIYPYVMPDYTSSEKYTSNGITFTTINDGDILVTGQITDNTKYAVFNFRREYETKNLFDNEAYYISGVPEISGSKSRIMFYFCNNGTVLSSLVQSISSSGGVVQTTKSFNQIICRLVIPNDDTTVFNHVFKIKITKIGYEPYGYKIPFVRKPYNYLHYPYNYAAITKNGVKIKELPDGSYVMNGSYNSTIEITMKNCYAPRKAIPDNTMLILQDFKKEADISTWVECRDDNNSHKWSSFCKNFDKIFIGNMVTDQYKNQDLLKLIFTIYNGTYAYNVRFMPYLRLSGEPYVYTTAYLDKPLRRGENINYIKNLLPDLPVDKGINDFYVDTYYKPKKSVIKYIGK